MSNADTDAPGESNVLLVDVGGNRGHDLVELRAKYPDLIGKMILQDLPDVVAHTSFEKDDNRIIEAMPHDFFQPQPVRRMSLPDSIPILFTTHHAIISANHLVAGQLQTL